MISYLQRPFLACLIWNGYTTDRARTAARKNHCSLRTARTQYGAGRHCASLCSAALATSSPIVFFSHTVLASASSHQPANNIFLSHHSSLQLQLQCSEQTSRLVLPQEAIEAKPRLGRGGDQAARGRRQAGGAVAAASIDLSAAGCAWGWHATRARILPSDGIRFGRRVRGGRGRHGY